MNDHAVPDSMAGLVSGAAMEPALKGKYEALKALIASYGSAAVAYSGGVDSTLLLVTARDVLGDRMEAVTACSSLFPDAEREEAARFCEDNGVRHRMVRIDEMRIDGFSRNTPDRCYLCKKTLFAQMMQTADSDGMAAVLEGTNVDDESDYRPGMRALRELGIKSPFREVRLTKEEIRTISRMRGLPTWSKPSYACLASRFVYGEEITTEKLRMVGAAEQFLREMGLTQLRVRIHGDDMARIEVLPEEMETLFALRKEVDGALRKMGFLYVTMDLRGYRTGSMNEALPGIVPGRTSAGRDGQDNG